MRVGGRAGQELRNGLQRDGDDSRRVGEFTVMPCGVQQGQERSHHVRGVASSKFALDMPELEEVDPLRRGVLPAVGEVHCVPRLHSFQAPPDASASPALLCEDNRRRERVCVCDPKSICDEVDKGPPATWLQLCLQL